ncbi:flagellar basal body P-ring formation chaperone FlgA [uncultured Microbulbifer sp.]|uniref:flagellar basal body P-ring formation chaperone FlgA n=1 Tax=uncultured Microbulbifer sp. TaxID=348147 RepID=UPI00261EDED5|nr:flagellar basal body P-ring formation chaperone FlgA [uncultured Microbulbifer sp.]
MSRPLLRSLALLLLLVSADQAAAKTALTTASAAAKQFLTRQSRHLGERVEIEVQDISDHWPSCKNPTVFLPANGKLQWGRVTVGIHCADAPHTRYLQAKIRAYGHYWTAKHRIPAGAEVTESLLKKIEGEISALPRGALRKRSEIVGKVASRTLRPGSVLQQHQLKTRPLVSRRQLVTLIASGQSFRIAREGRAMDEGARGEPVRVRLPNRKVISGFVSGPGLVEVNQAIRPRKSP